MEGTVGAEGDTVGRGMRRRREEEHEEEEEEDERWIVVFLGFESWDKNKTR